MKLTALTSAIALVPAAAFAAIDTTPFKMIAVSSDPSVDGAHLKATERYFFIGRETNSTCGDVDPILAMGNINGTLTMYRSPTANYSQTAFVDISGVSDGLFAYSWPEYFSTPSNAYPYLNQFFRVGDRLQYDGQDWLACAGSESDFWVYSEKDYAKESKDGCVPFQIRTEKVQNATSCKYFA